MTKEELLKASIDEFRDKKDNALFWTCERIYTNSGYCYILKKESRKISCALHYNRYFETDENIGKYENNDMTITTREDLGFNGIIEYKGIYCAFNRQGNWNATMGQYHYVGIGAFTPISNQFLITDLQEIETKIGVNSMPLFMNLNFKDVVIMPAYYAANSLKKYVMVNTEPLKDLTGIIMQDEYYQQIKCDNVKLTFVNFKTNEAMEFLNNLQNLSLSENASFGFLSLPTLITKDTYQVSFNWKALAYESEFKINYNLKGFYDDKNNIIHITNNFFNMLKIS